MGDGRVDALNRAVAELSGLPRAVRLLGRRVEAPEEERRALFAELEACAGSARRLRSEPA